MKNIFLFLVSIGVSLTLVAQNSFPTSPGSNVTIDGGSIDMNHPITTGGWARGMMHNTSDGAARVGGVGMHGTGETPSSIYLAHGASPWASTSGMHIKADGKIGIGTTAPSTHLEIRQGVLKISGTSTLGEGTSRFIISTGASTGHSPMELKNDNGTVMKVLGDGRVGIGTNSPVGGLEVKHDDGIRVRSITGTFTPGAIKMADGLVDAAARDDMLFSTAGGFMFKMDDNNNGISTIPGFSLYDRGNNNVFSIKESDGEAKFSGNVGIGMNPGGWKLAIQGNVNIGGAMNAILRVRHVDGKDADSPDGDNLYLNYNNNKDVFVGNAGDAANLTRLFVGGALGIGTTTLGTWKLAVDGHIRAKELKVETGWSDYVFYDDYDLPTLEEVEAHIEEKGHLMNIPSAAEVEEHGIFVGEMHAKLLEKIEELTLYTIDQEKRIATQDRRIQQLEEMIIELADH